MPALSGKTRLVAIFGWPLSYTLSPLFQNAALRRAGIDAVYTALPAESSADFLRLARGLMASPHFVGANVTNPHKVAALKLAQRLSPAARAIGAVNTLSRRGGTWWGDNTDAAGFRLALKAGGVRLKGSRVLILGAGGASRAAAWAAAQAGARRVLVLARRASQARACAAAAGSRGLSGRLDADTLSLAGLAADLVVNALPGEALGGSYASCLPKAWRRGACAMDLASVPARTEFMRRAEARGWRSLGGRGMLLEQGREAFRLWFGRRPAGGPLKALLERA